MPRQSWDSCFIAMAQEVAKMGTCARRRVGCVLVDDSRFVLSTGVNGVPPGWPHCRDNFENFCPGTAAPSGTALDLCVANHSEANALLHCADVMRAHTCYCTTSPCISCVKLLLCTNIVRVVFIEDYAQKEAAELWTRYDLEERDRARTITRSWYRTWERWNPATGLAEVIRSSEK
jgi:dCMP deaminase